jgi:SAM-dependent methyltransferase
MLRRAQGRVQRARLGRRVRLVRGDIRALPFPPERFSLVAAPYGILQSLLREADLASTLRAVHAVLAPGGRLVVELVADLASWQEYRGETRLRGWRPGRKAHVTLVESVRQDRRKALTLFEQEFIERRGGATSRKRFSLAFRTLSVPQMTRRLEKAGLQVTSRLGSYEGGPWTPESEAWILVAERGPC